ncbi:tetratricopeptide repeat protein [Roseateles asaccharophilus]|uniref:TPR repeat protein n=1 Tax=Roseateles asaccharophilus TaxID=582607 RepID=A0ABU2AEJ3_9BURK|nr:tetratricopeptide repeat protein [Roseateles asaccharophilus]MDR7335609.1 TPR repeat protein [Roseateles asaccharophilus]
MKTAPIAALLLALSMAHAATLSEALTAYDDGNLKAAAQGFAASAARGEALGQFNLAMMHLRRELPGASDARAWHWLQRAAAQQYARAENALGEMIENGRRGKRDPKAACDWFERAAEHGNGDGALATATCYYLGRGRAQDMVHAHRWYLEAAKAGDVGAQYLVASMFETGLGVEADARLARYWYNAAARNGDVAARAKLKAMEAADAST